MDKSQVMLNFIRTCPYLTSKTAFFNFGKVEDDAYQMITRSDDVNLQKPYIDGSVLKRYTMSIDCFKAVGINAIVTNLTDENLDEFKNVQDVLNWFNAQNDAGNFPSFGTNIIVDEMKTLTEKPELLSVDTSKEPMIAVYRITIQVDYLDRTKCLS